MQRSEQRVRKKWWFSLTAIEVVSEPYIHDMELQHEVGV
jgi:hypothetical protein